MRVAVFVLSLCLISVQCGYHLLGTGSFLPSHIQKVYLPMFKNLTTRFDLDRKLTQGVIDELVIRGKVEIISTQEGADARLLGEITSFRVNPIGFSEGATADRYNISIVVKIVLRDLANNKVIFSHPNFIYQEDYEVPEGSDFESVETEAIDSVSEKFARSLVISMLEGF